MRACRRIVSALMMISAAAQAGFCSYVVGFGSTALVVPGGTGVLDVRVQAEASDPVLDYYVIRLDLEPVGNATATGVRFASPQKVAYADDPAYVFAGNSAALTREVSQAGARLTLADFTLDNAGADSSGPGRLLARLEFDADPGLAPGSQYRVRIAVNFSQFQAPSFDDIPFAAESLGTVEVTAVPEPRSLALTTLGLVAASLGWASRRKRTRQAPRLASAARSVSISGSASPHKP